MSPSISPKLSPTPIRTPLPAEASSSTATPKATTPTVEVPKIKLPNAPVSEETKQGLKKEGGEFKAGTHEASSAVKKGIVDGKQAAKPQAKEAKQAGGEALDAFEAAGSKTIKAGKKALGATGAFGKKASENAAEVGAGVARAGTGAYNGAARVGSGVAGAAKTTGATIYNAASKPVIWSYNKIGNAANNLATPRPSETTGSWLGATMLLGGLSLFAAATAASWSATFFITLPTLALGTALLGATMLGVKLGKRLFTGPSAATTTEGTLPKDTKADRCAQEMEAVRTKYALEIEADIAKIDKDEKAIIKASDSIKEKSADVQLRKAIALSQKAQVEAERVARTEAAIIDRPQPVGKGKLPETTGGFVKPVVTDTETLTGDQTEITTDLKSGGNITAPKESHFAA